LTETDSILFHCFTITQHTAQHDLDQEFSILSTATQGDIF